MYYHTFTTYLFRLIEFWARGFRSLKMNRFDLVVWHRAWWSNKLIIYLVCMICIWILLVLFFYFYFFSVFCLFISAAVGCVQKSTLFVLMHEWFFFLCVPNAWLRVFCGCVERPIDRPNELVLTQNRSMDKFCCGSEVTKSTKRIRKTSFSPRNKWSVWC